MAGAADEVGRLIHGLREDLDNIDREANQEIQRVLSSGGGGLSAAAKVAMLNAIVAQARADVTTKSTAASGAIGQEGFKLTGSGTTPNPHAGGTNGRGGPPDSTQARPSPDDTIVGPHSGPNVVPAHNGSGGPIPEHGPGEPPPPSSTERRGASEPAPTQANSFGNQPSEVFSQPRVLRHLDAEAWSPGESRSSPRLFRGFRAVEAVVARSVVLAVVGCPAGSVALAAFHRVVWRISPRPVV